MFLGDARDVAVTCVINPSESTPSRIMRGVGEDSRCLLCLRCSLCCLFDYYDNVLFAVGCAVTSVTMTLSPPIGVSDAYQWAIGQPWPVLRAALWQVESFWCRLEGMKLVWSSLVSLVLSVRTPSMYLPFTPVVHCNPSFVSDLLKNDVIDERKYQR